MYVFVTLDPKVIANIVDAYGCTASGTISFPADNTYIPQPTTVPYPNGVPFKGNGTVFPQPAPLPCPTCGRCPTCGHK